MSERSMLVELLAIKLYEHDYKTYPPPPGSLSWGAIANEDREIYRKRVRERTYPK